MQEVNLLTGRCDYIRLMALRPPEALRAELEREIVAREESISEGIATMNPRVNSRDNQTGDECCVERGHLEEADSSAGKISVFAPVGVALLGLGIGQDIEWDFANGAVRRLTVVSATQLPAAIGTESSATEPSH